MTKSKTIPATLMAATLAMSAAPTMAQHRAATHPGNHPATGYVHPGTHPGMNQGPTQAQIRQWQIEQEAMHRQQQAAWEHQMRMEAAAREQHARQQAELARQAQQYHDEQMRKFRDHVESSGGKADIGGFPSNPAALKAWENKQKANKGHGKAYDPLYDHFVTYQAASRPNKAVAGSTAAKAPATATAAKSSTGTASAAGDAKAAATAAKAPTGKAPAAANAKAPASMSLATSAPGGFVAAGWRSWNPSQADLSLISDLRLIRWRLALADHDYDGQRVYAIRSIGRALYYLDPSVAPGLETGTGVLRYPTLAAAIAAPVTPGAIGTNYGLDVFGFGFEYEHQQGPSNGYVGGSGYLSQSNSDAILRGALIKLSRLEPRLLGRSGTLGNPVMAHAEVVSAIDRLQIALSIR